MSHSFPPSETLIRTRNLTKRFGRVLANDAINFKVKRGEIYALLGENGAGKSTLMNMLSGVYTPDEGEIRVHGKKVFFRSPEDSIRCGIGMIYQHFKLIEVMTALENIIIGRREELFISTSKIRRRVMEIASRYGLPLDPDKKVYDMSVGEKQTVEIMKVLYRGADILILDEPTAVLTPQETDNLFSILRRMKEEGCGVIIITHKLHEVMEISDWVTVLRKGQNVGNVKTSETSHKKLADLMVGRSLDLSIEHVHIEQKSPTLEVRDLTLTDHEHVRKIASLSFTLFSGEILGVAGISGSGQKELCEALAGLYPVQSGDIVYKGESIVGLSSREIIDKGITMSFIPEDRLGMGLVASMDLTDNVILKDYYQSPGLFVDRKSAQEKTVRIIKDFNIQTPGPHHPVKLLSGGNIQKVLLGREIMSLPHLLITAYPTRGLDIASSYLIYDYINREKKKGTPILYVGEDLDVLLELCDRIMVLCDGKMTGIVDTDKTTKETLGLLMAGETLDSIARMNHDSDR